MKLKHKFILLLLSFLGVTGVAFLKFSQDVSAAVPSGFNSQQIIGSGIAFPTALGIAPDGRIFILEQSGQIKIYKNGQLLPTFFDELPASNYGDRGLLGVVFDPDWNTNHYVYFYYIDKNDLFHKIVRFNGAGDVATDGPVEIFNSHFPAGGNHVGGSLEFGSDGKLYVGIGDSGLTYTAQDLNAYTGKILRINKDGSIPTDNPFYGQAGKKGEIWAYGFRNPFRFQFDSATGVMYEGDVGEGLWEEINVIEKGGNYGWPQAEGVSSNPAFKNPIYAYFHTTPGFSVTGGPIYNGTQFPESYRGKYFFGDFAQGFIKTMEVHKHEDGSVHAHDPVSFEPGADSVVDIKVGTDGSLYYVTIYPGKVYKVTYGSSNLPPVAKVAANKLTGNAPLEATFSSSGSSDPEGAPLTYLWNFGDGTTSTDANPSHTFSTLGKFTVTLIVSDGTNTSSSAAIDVQVGTVPVLNITSPSSSYLYKGGDTIFYGATATDGNTGQTLPDSAFTLEIRFHHNIHYHPFIRPINSRSGSFVIPTTGELASDVWYKIIITAKDSLGLTTAKELDIYPEQGSFTLQTSPPGMKLWLDGQEYTAPKNVNGVVGINRDVEAKGQTFNGELYEFEKWSDGGPRKRVISTPQGNPTFTAVFRKQVPFTGEYFSNKDLTGTPTLTRTDNTINFDWGNGAPAAGMPQDGWSVRWTKKQNFTFGRYKFTTASDDGNRLYIDGKLVISDWNQHGEKASTTILELSEGEHDIKMEYFDAGGGAIARLFWELTPDQPTIPTGPPTISFVTPAADLNDFVAYNDVSYAISAKDTSGQDLPASAVTVQLVKIDNGTETVTQTVNGLSGTFTLPIKWLSTTHYEIRAKGTSGEFSATAVRKIFPKVVKIVNVGLGTFANGAIINGVSVYGGGMKYSVNIPAVSGSEIQMEKGWYCDHGDTFSCHEISGSTPSIAQPQDFDLSVTYTNVRFYKNTVFPNVTLSGDGFENQYLITREFGFDIKDGAPDFQTPRRAPADNFSLRSTNTHTFSAAGNYEFTLKADGGVRLFVDGDKIIDSWDDKNTVITTKGTKTLTSGDHVVTVEYFDSIGNASASLTWVKLADVPPVTPDPFKNWNAQYYNNMDLSGTPAVTRTDAVINFDWLSFSPDASLPSDRFSARWTKVITFEPGKYEFTSYTDDGVRVYVDGQVAIDKWVPQGPTQYSAQRDFNTAGSRTIVVEYFEKAGGAVAVFNLKKVGDVIPPSPVFNNWKGEYFANNSLAGDPVLTRDDAAIAFQWNQFSPASSLPVDNYSARWTRTINFELGNYKFTATADDGVRVYIDGEMVLNKWKDQSTTYEFEKSLSAGNHDIKVEYYERGGHAKMFFNFAKVGGAVLPPPPPVITPTTTPTSVFKGEYFNNQFLQGTPVLTRDDAKIFFNWDRFSPDASIPKDKFSARWTAVKTFEARDYTFNLGGDDGIRLYIDGQLVIDAWKDQSVKFYQVNKNMTAGNHDIKVEYYENGGSAEVYLNIQ